MLTFNKYYPEKLHVDHVSEEKRILSETLALIFHNKLPCSFSVCQQLVFFTRLSTLVNKRSEAPVIFEVILYDMVSLISPLLSHTQDKQ